MTGTQRLVLVCGLPGAGRTTPAKRLPAARLCPAEWLARFDPPLVP